MPDAGATAAMAHLVLRLFAGVPVIADQAQIAHRLRVQIHAVEPRTQALLQFRVPQCHAGIGKPDHYRRITRLAICRIRSILRISFCSERIRRPCKCGLCSPSNPILRFE